MWGAKAGAGLSRERYWGVPGAESEAGHQFGKTACGWEQGRGGRGSKRHSAVKQKGLKVGGVGVRDLPIVTAN